MSDVFVLDYVRTPRGKASARGSLHHRSPIDLVVSLLQALDERNALGQAVSVGQAAPVAVTDVTLGVASQVGEQGANLARTAALMAGWHSAVAGLTVNRFCASGIDAVALAAARIHSGEASLLVAGGVESVSRVPIFSDHGPLWSDPAVIAGVGSVHMGIAADLDATLSGRQRAELDAYAIETHTKAAAAWDAGIFNPAVVPQPAADGDGSVTTDELIRADLTIEDLAALPPAFAELGSRGQDDLVAAKHPDVGPLKHLHTVGSSPQMADGAALLLLGDRAAAERLRRPPIAKIVGSATCAVDPVVMLTAGQAAVEEVLARNDLCPADIDVFEFAEAFSSLCLRFRDAMEAGPDRMNPNGGTMAMGHAFGATGAIMVGGCATELQRRSGGYGVAAVSGAAGLGTAVLLEREG